jgi:hypothetical protein
VAESEYGQVYSKLEEMFNKYDGAKCTADSVFHEKKYMCVITSSSSQDPLTAQGETRAEVEQNVRIQLEATSMHQAATKWGMRAIQSFFPHHLKDHFVHEENGEQQRILHSLFLLYNLRTKMVGINQICNVYMTFLRIEKISTANKLVFNHCYYQTQHL